MMTVEAIVFPVDTRGITDASAIHSLKQCRRASQVGGVTVRRLGAGQSFRQPNETFG